MSQIAEMPGIFSERRFMCYLKVLGLKGRVRQTVGAAKPRYALG